MFPSQLVRTVTVSLGCLFVSAAAQAAPTGHLGLILNGDAVVESLPGGGVTKLPHGGNARQIALTPGGLAAYFVAPAGNKVNYEDDTPAAMTGYLSPAPYQTAWAFPAAVQNQQVDSLTWNGAGDSLYIGGEKVQGNYHVAGNSFQAKSTSGAPPATAAHWVDESTDKAIIVHNLKTGQRIVIFSEAHPEPLFAAVRAARHGANVKDLSDEIDPTLWKDPNNWNLGNVIFTADGTRAFFTTNVGNGSGAAGNTSFGLFAYDLVKDKLGVLSRVGAQFGRLPNIFELSPDGLRLLMVVSVHNSALDNSSFATVIDLLTQKSREVLLNVPEAKLGTNFFSNACWSPDGKYVAVSAYFFDANKVTDNWSGPAAGDWITWIKSAASGSTVSRIQGGQSPSWGR